MHVRVPLVRIEAAGREQSVDDQCFGSQATCGHVFKQASIRNLPLGALVR